MLGFDETSYNIYYEQIIRPVVNEYQRETFGLKVREDAKERIWKNYVKFNRHCREEYMLEPEKLTDRHKIVACYMYAIIKADVLVCDLSIQMDDDRHMLLNERLAFCFGMTLLRSLIRAKAKELKDETLRENVRKAFDSEPIFPNVNHGDYRDNLLYPLRNRLSRLNCRQDKDIRHKSRYKLHISGENN